jgi:hypothetical protein
VSGYRLLVDWDVIEKVSRLPLPQRRALKDAFVRIGRFPDRMSDYMEPNDRSIALSIHLSHGFAIKYWTDFADRHVKILEIVSADQI